MNMIPRVMMTCMDCSGPSVLIKLRIQAKFLNLCYVNFKRKINILIVVL